ncbi:MerR family transcriptional regulator [Streptococcus dentiloxodontae]
MIITGLTKRTLHYYDQIGLLPAGKLANGYRTYSQQDLIDLQRILFLKALDFSIKEIQSLLKLSDEDLRPILEEQQTNLAQKIQDLQKKKAELENFLAGAPLIDLAVFEKPLNSQYQAEAELRYGGTLAYQTYQDRQAQLDSVEKTQYAQKMNQQFDQVFQEFKRVSHLPLSAAEVAAAVEQWKTALLMVSDFSDEVLIYIAKSYVCDSRFKAYFAKYGNPGLTRFISAAVAYHLQ